MESRNQAVLSSKEFLTSLALLILPSLPLPQLLHHLSPSPLSARFFVSARCICIGATNRGIERNGRKKKWEAIDYSPEKAEAMQRQAETN